MYAHSDPTVRQALVEQCQELMETTKVTLDGNPAIIVGFKLRFAQVKPLNNKLADAEYAWETVINVLSKGGNFIS